MFYRGFLGIVVAPSNSGKTTYILDEIRYAPPSQSRVWFFTFDEEEDDDASSHASSVRTPRNDTFQRKGSQERIRRRQRHGITTDDGLKMVPEILAADPQAIVIELGGHDYNADKKTRAATRKNLVQLIESFTTRDIKVVLIEIPRGFVYDPYDGLERELAATYDLQMIDDSLIRGLIFNSPILPPGSWRDSSKRYSEDGLHPNELGNEYFAARVSRALLKVYGPSVLRNQE